MAAADLTTEDGISNYLRKNNYPFCPKVNRVERLEGAYTNFVFRVLVDQSATPTIIVKHAAAYAARAQSWKLDQSRLGFEAQAINLLSQLELSSEIAIRVPKLLHYDAEKHLIVLEDVGTLPNLKGWLQPGADSNLTTSIGETLGKFLAQVHNATGGKRDIFKKFNGNTTATNLYSTLYFGSLSSTAEKLGYTDDFFGKVADMGRKEVEESNEVLLLGDFWTGNILVDATAPRYSNLYVLDFELSKPGTAAFDVGQMAAEIYCLASFRDRDLGVALLENFLRAYKASYDGPIDAAKVAIRFGVHLLVTMPVVWLNEATSDQINEATDLGVNLIRMGWYGDMEGLQKSTISAIV